MPVTKEEFEAWWEKNWQLPRPAPFGHGLKGWAWASVDHFCNGAELNPYEVGKQALGTPAKDAIDLMGGGGCY